MSQFALPQELPSLNRSSPEAPARGAPVNPTDGRFAAAYDQESSSALSTGADADPNTDSLQTDENSADVRTTHLNPDDTPSHAKSVTPTGRSDADEGGSPIPIGSLDTDIRDLRQPAGGRQTFSSGNESPVSGAGLLRGAIAGAGKTVLVNTTSADGAPIIDEADLEKRFASNDADTALKSQRSNQNTPFPTLARTLSTVGGESAIKLAKAPIETITHAGSPASSETIAAPVVTAADIASAATSASPKLVSTPELARAVQSQLVAAVNTRGDGNRVEVALDPPELGRIIIDFDLNKAGVVKAVVHAENPQTFELLKRHLDDLRSGLFDGGDGEIDLSMGEQKAEGEDNKFTDAQDQVKNDHQTNDHSDQGHGGVKTDDQRSISVTLGAQRLDLRV